MVIVGVGDTVVLVGVGDTVVLVGVGGGVVDVGVGVGVTIFATTSNTQLSVEVGVGVGGTVVLVGVGGIGVLDGVGVGVGVDVGLGVGVGLFSIQIISGCKLLQTPESLFATTLICVVPIGILSTNKRRSMVCPLYISLHKTS